MSYCDAKIDPEDLLPRARAVIRARVVINGQDRLIDPNPNRSRRKTDIWHAMNYWRDRCRANHTTVTKYVPTFNLNTLVAGIAIGALLLEPTVGELLRVFFSILIVWLLFRWKVTGDFLRRLVK